MAKAQKVFFWYFVVDEKQIVCGGDSRDRTQKQAERMVKKIYAKTNPNSIIREAKPEDINRLG